MPVTTASRSAALGTEFPLLMVGTDHRCADLELRERVAQGPTDTAETLERLLALPEIAEAYLLSTCNRIEVYVLPTQPERAYRTALEVVFLSRAAEIESEGRFYVKRSREASRHLLAVAAGLESMVLGEPEILGQVRQAAGQAESLGAAGPVLRRLLRAAAAAGARARRETAISAGAVSMGYAVVELARQVFDRLEDRAALVLGAGDTGRQAARSLLEKGIGSVSVANRTPERAKALAEELAAIRVLAWHDVGTALPEADLVVAATSGQHVLTRDALATARRARGPRPLLVVDLGVPRNVEPEAGRLPNLFLHNLDSLDNLIERNLRRRRDEVARVQEIIDQELAVFHAWCRNLAAEPLIARLHKQGERIRLRELERARQHLPAEAHAEIDRLTRSIVRKLLHRPSSRLRAGEDRDSLARLDLVQELFALEEEEEETP